jgi:Putative transposase
VKGASRHTAERAVGRPAIGRVDYHRARRERGCRVAAVLRTGSVLPYPIRGGNTDFERHLCVGRNGVTLHAAMRAGGADSAGREGLLKYILRPPLAQERLLPAKDGLVRITIKRTFSDGTMAIDLDPLSPLSRLAAAVPYPRFHTVRYAGVLAAAVSCARLPTAMRCDWNFALCRGAGGGGKLRPPPNSRKPVRG